MIQKNKYQLLKFLIVGGFNTLFSYIVFFTLYYFIQQKEITVSLTFIIVILFNYQTISRYVFSNSNEKKFIIFVSVYLVGYFLNLIHLWITVDIYRLNVYWAQILTLFYLPLLSFYLNKKYVFNTKVKSENIKL